MPRNYYKDTSETVLIERKGRGLEGSHKLKLITRTGRYVDIRLQPSTIEAHWTPVWPTKLPNEGGQMGSCDQVTAGWVDMQPLRTASDMINIVLYLSSRNAKGLVVRVGPYAQGVFQTGSEVSIERWESIVNGKWHRVLKLGKHYVPCHITFEHCLKLGDKIRYGSAEWEVMEKDGSSVI